MKNKVLNFIKMVICGVIGMHLADLLWKYLH